MKKLIYVSVLLISLTGFSQSSGSFSFSGTGNTLRTNRTHDGTWVTTRAEDNSLIGSEYIYKTWQPKTSVYTVDGNKYVVSFMNFNARLNRFSASVSPVGQDSVFIFNSSNILKVKIKNKKFIKISNKFYEEIFAKEDFRLLKFYKASIKSAPIDLMSQQKSGQDRIVVESSYFLEKESVKMFKVKTKTILSLLEDKKTEVQAFIKSNRLSVKNENHLKRIFNYYNSL